MDAQFAQLECVCVGLKENIFWWISHTGCLAQRLLSIFLPAGTDDCYVSYESHRMLFNHHDVCACTSIYKYNIHKHTNTKITIWLMNLVFCIYDVLCVELFAAASGMRMILKGKYVMELVWLFFFLFNSILYVPTSYIVMMYYKVVPICFKINICRYALKLYLQLNWFFIILLLRINKNIRKIGKC